MKKLAATVVISISAGAGSVCLVVGRGHWWERFRISTDAEDGRSIFHAATFEVMNLGAARLARGRNIILETKNSDVRESGQVVARGPALGS